MIESTVRSIKGEKDRWKVFPLLEEIHTTFCKFLFSLSLYCMCVPVCVCAKSLQSCPTLCDPGTIAHPALLSMEFPRQEYWSGLSFPIPGDLPDPGTEPVAPVVPPLAGGFFPTHHLGSLSLYDWNVNWWCYKQKTTTTNGSGKRSEGTHKIYNPSFWPNNYKLRLFACLCVAGLSGLGT